MNFPPLCHSEYVHTLRNKSLIRAGIWRSHSDHEAGQMRLWRPEKLNVVNVAMRPGSSEAAGHSLSVCYCILKRARSPEMKGGLSGLPAASPRPSRLQTAQVPSDESCFVPALMWPLWQTGSEGVLETVDQYPPQFHSLQSFRHTRHENFPPPDMF